MMSVIGELTGASAAGPSRPVSDEIIAEGLDEVVVRGAGEWVMLTEVAACVSSAAARHDLALLPQAGVERGSRWSVARSRAG